LHTKDAREYPGLSTLVRDHLTHQSSDLKIKNQLENTNIKNAVCQVLEQQYRHLNLPLPAGLSKFREDGVRTVTTGHQLQIAGGPAFLHYKTITAIRLARQIEKETGEKVVPVFWLASEDHDFKEVSWVNGEVDKLKTASWKIVFGWSERLFGVLGEGHGAGWDRFQIRLSSHL
jgi:uncharacterized protein YllA (UPF0747 family)